ncbi:MAG: class I SAM-dependent methyltransferase [Pseudomonadota bacterium]
MSTAELTYDAEQWFATPLGAYLLAREQEYFDRVVADIFGYNAFQLGLTGHDLLRASRIPLRCGVDANGSASIRADFRDLPIASNSADLVVLPHVLEFSEDPHQILREIERVLMPEGQVVISCFNPWSLWGLRRVFSAGTRYPWRGRFINLPRLKDWLSLLGFELAAGQMRCYAPPCAQQKWLAHFGFMEPAGDRWWPMAGGVYFLQAVKRVRGMRLITPRWSDRLAPKENLAVVPKKVRQPEDAVAARTPLGGGQ